MDEFLRTLPGIGVGGALAVMIFYFYRIDHIATFSRYAELVGELMKVVKENTVAMTTLSESINNLKDNLRR